MKLSKILAYTLGPIGAGMLGLISLPIITWFFSIEDVGRISMLQVIASFSILIFCLGLDQAYTREYHEVESKPELLKLTLMPGLLLIIIVYALVFLINPLLVSELLYGIPSSALSLISIICFIISLISRFLSLVLRMEERALAYSMSQLLPKIVFLIFIVSTVWLGFQKDIYTLVTAHLLSISSVCLVFLWNTREQWIRSFYYPFAWKRMKPLLLFGAPLVIAGLAAWGLNVMDRLFLRSLSTFSALGVYSVTTSLATAATVFASVFNTIWSPLVYKWLKTENINIHKVDEISEHLLSAIFFITILSGLCSWILPYLLPDEYEAVRYLITPCLMAPLLYTLSETTGIGITITRKTSYSMFASIGAMLINGVGNYLLIPYIDALGAAISTTLAFWFFYIFRTEFSRNVWREMPRKKPYLITFILILTVIIDSTLLRHRLYSISLWLILGVLGFIIFKPSIMLAKVYTFKLYAKKN